MPSSKNQRCQQRSVGMVFGMRGAQSILGSSIRDMEEMRCFMKDYILIQQLGDGDGYVIEAMTWAELTKTLEDKVKDEDWTPRFAKILPHYDSDFDEGTVLVIKGSIVVPDAAKVAVKFKEPS